MCRSAQLRSSTNIDHKLNNVTQTKNTKTEVHSLFQDRETGVTEYSDLPEIPGTSPGFTENMVPPHFNVPPLTQGAEAYSSSGFSLTLEPSDTGAISPSTFALNITFC